MTSVSVLFVDDEPNILAAIRRLLLDEDFDVLTASSGEEGLALLENSPGIGVIVSDQRMPGMGGVEFLEKAREVAPEALRLILTGYADTESAIGAINRGGACRYIHKPWDDGDLTQSLREAVRTYSLQQENRRLQELIGQKNEELRQWNDRLKTRVLQQTAKIRETNEELRLQNARLKENNQEIVKALAGLIEMKNKTLRNHSRNVARISALIATDMGLSRAETEMINVAGILHDIGEIGNPDHLADCNIYELEGEDLSLYIQHTVRGQAAIDVIQELRPAGVLIRHHHEHFDGTGLPDGLQGEEIPLGARILAAADFIDRRMVTLLPDTTRNPAEIILSDVQERSGEWFDPRILPYLGRPIREIYGELASKASMVEQIRSPEMLQEGMILKHDLYTGTGLLLLSKGSLLAEKEIAAILRHHDLDPFRGGIAVYTKGSAID